MLAGFTLFRFVFKTSNFKFCLLRYFFCSFIKPSGVNGFGSTGKLKKMEKVVIEEFDCCHSFIERCVCFILPLNERIFVHVTHLVGGGKFFIFVSYDKEQLNTKINQFITDIIKESKNWDDLRKYWNVNEPLVEGYENPEWKLFPYGITFTFREK